MIRMEGFTPYPEEFARQYREKGFWKDKTISQVLDESFNRFSDQTILYNARTRNTAIALLFFLNRPVF